MRAVLLFCTITLSIAQEHSWNPFRTVVDDWKTRTATIQSFFDNQSEKVRNYFETQNAEAEKALDTGFENAKAVTVSIGTYMEDQRKKISDSMINNYIDNVKNSGRQMVDKWSYASFEEPEARLDNPDVVLSVPSIIGRHGYNCETHIVVSQGYVLNIHRIPHSRTGGDIPKKTVLLQHGLLASSADWIINGPDKSLAYVLADTGYDVWMPNIRGNKYSREHTTVKTDSKSYWNFSWHDVALHDVPAVIDYIRKLKGNSVPITYIGHSMGTTILFAMLTLRPEYNTILDSAIALAPVVFMSDIKSPVQSLAPIASNAAYMDMLFGSRELVPKDSVMGKLTPSCNAEVAGSMLCKNALFYISGYDEKQVNKSLLPMYIAHLGTGTSVKTAMHFAQEIASGGRFQMFDNGYYHNLKIYGTETPPEYDLGRVTLPISLFWAQNDLLSSEKDVMELYSKLPSGSTELHLVPYPKFNHVDYLFAIDAPRLLNDEVLKTLKKRERPVGFRLW